MLLLLSVCLLVFDSDNKAAGSAKHNVVNPALYEADDPAKRKVYERQHNDTDDTRKSGKKISGKASYAAKS